jgi:hypothetical protein
MPDEPSKMIRVPTPLIDAVRELSRLHRQGRTLAVLEGVERLVAAIDSFTDIDIDSLAQTISRLTSRLERLESEREREETAVDIAEITLSISELTERLEKVEGDIEAIAKRCCEAQVALTQQDLNVRVSDWEGVGDIGYTTNRLSELEVLDDIESGIDLTAEPIANDYIDTDIESMAEPRAHRDISIDSEKITEVQEPTDIVADSDAIASSKSLLRLQAPLTQSALAKRLSVSDGAIQKHRQQGKESFAQWSRNYDPDGIAWAWKGRGGRGQPLRFVPTKAE